MTVRLRLAEPTLFVPFKTVATFALVGAYGTVAEPANGGVIEAPATAGSPLRVAAMTVADAASASGSSMTTNNDSVRPQ